MRAKFEFVLLFIVCAGVISGYFWISGSAVPQYGAKAAEDQHYNLLAAGFRAGQLSLKRDPPPELANLPDPYDPRQNAPYRLQDVSYYRGKYYLYFGLTPALVLFWPYLALTGHALYQKEAVALFCAVGFLVAVGLLWQIRRRHFPEIGAGVMTGMAVAVGMANGVPLLLRRPEVYEVSIACAYAMTTAALAALWCALQGDRPRLGWTAAASLFYGLAIGARPNFLFGALILFVPIAIRIGSRGKGPRTRADGVGLVLAAWGPVAVIVAGLGAYNAVRFGNPLEFGQKYQMAVDRISDFTLFSWRYLWFNLRVYFFLPTRLMGYFPFVWGIGVPPPPRGYWLVENPYGVLVNMPFVFLALAAPLAALRSAPEGSAVLRWFVRAVAWIFFSSAAVLCFYVVACVRYELDFLPYLVVLAAIGVFGLETGLANRPRLLLAGRITWQALLGVSVLFNFFACCQHLNLLAYDDQKDFRALSRLFDYPAYAYHGLVTQGAQGKRSGPAVQGPGPLAVGGDGPVSLRFDLPVESSGVREPLLVCGNVGEVDSAFLVYVRLLPDNQVSFGLQYWGFRYAESVPVRLESKVPVEVEISLPVLQPVLGDQRWGTVAYEQQMIELSRYTITVNGSIRIQLQGLIDRPISTDVPVFVGTNPIGGSLVADRFGDAVFTVARMGMIPR